MTPRQVKQIRKKRYYKSNLPKISRNNSKYLRKEERGSKTLRKSTQKLLQVRTQYKYSKQNLQLNIKSVSPL